MENRRNIIRNSLAAGVGVVVGVNAMTPGIVCGYQFVSDTQDDTKEKPPASDNDRKAVMSAGFTEAEADCWKQTAQAAGAFFALPELHPMDKQEVATAIHVIQNKLLGRPTYRKYLKEARRLHGPGQKERKPEESLPKEKSTKGK